MVGGYKASRAAFLHFESAENNARRSRDVAQTGKDAAKWESAMAIFFNRSLPNLFNWPKKLAKSRKFPIYGWKWGATKCYCRGSTVE